MKTKECPSCAMVVGSNNKVCPICNYEFPTSHGILKWVALLLAILFLFWALFL